MTDNLNPQKLYDTLSVQDIDAIQQYFESLDDGLSYEQFRQFLRDYNIDFSDSDFVTLCLRIDMDRDSRIKFREFISYFITELQNDDNAAERLSIVPPIAHSPMVLAQTQRNLILRVFYVETLMRGCYLTVGCFGDLYIWSSKWKLERIVFVGEELIVLFYWWSKLVDEYYKKKRIKRENCKICDKKLQIKT